MVPYCKLLIVLTCCAWHESFIFAAADSVFQVPLVNLMDLESLGSALEFGLIAIKADTNLATVRHGALEGLCNCVLDSDRFLEINGANQAQLSDGMTTRTSFPTATMGTTPLPLPLQLGSTCGPDTVAHMEELRDEVAVVAQQFVDAVDGVLASRTPHGAPLLWTSHGASYLSVASIVKASTNLEHFHVYSKKAETFGSQEYSFETVDTALGLHMDAGLFLAFVPGFDCSNHGDDDSLYVSVDGKVQRAVFPPGSVAIMLGVGAESWLTPSIGRATRHAVRMSASQRRAWYGMMHAVPEKAIIQSNPDRTFADMRQMMANIAQGRVLSNDYDMDEISIGCGSVSTNDHVTLNDENKLLALPQRSRSRLQHVADGSVCNNSTNFYCWISCLSIPEASQAESYLKEGYSLYCADPSTLASTGNSVTLATNECAQYGVIGALMNVACMGAWVKTAPGVPAQAVIVNSTLNTFSEPFCYGATSMYMTGFEWARAPTCLVFLFPQWVLSTSDAWVGACIGTFCLGVLLEYVVRTRRKLAQSSETWAGIAASTCVYGLQLTLGYFLMLIVMTYSGPLFVCAVSGLMAGHIKFKTLHATNDANNDLTTTLENGEGQASSDEGSTPCCQHDQ